MRSEPQPGRFVFEALVQWLHGAGIVAVGVGGWFVLDRLRDILDGMFGGVGGGLALAALALLIVPWVVGWIGPRLTRPLFRRWEAARGIAQWEGRLVEELAPDDRRGFPVVLVPWPSLTVRSLGVITNTFTGTAEGATMASVYIPNTPDARRGLLRIVPISELESTRFKLGDLLQFQLSYGAASPKTLTEVEGGVGETTSR